VTLTIIVPTFNRNDVVVGCVGRLARSGAEIVVVDDASPRPVRLVDHPAVRLIRHDRNRGRAAAVNTGLRAATHDTVLVVDDDIYAGAGMVERLFQAFTRSGKRTLALVGRVVWAPEIPVTLTMRWLEECGPARDLASAAPRALPTLSTGNTVFDRSFVLEQGGFDEGFTRYGLEDVELGLRLKRHGLEVQLVPDAVGYHHKSMRVDDLVRRELDEGRSAVHLHGTFPDYLPIVDDLDLLALNERSAAGVAASLTFLRSLEEAGEQLMPAGGAEMFAGIYEYYFRKGILDAIGPIEPTWAQRRRSSALATYNRASHLESLGDHQEAKRLFLAVRNGPDQEHWSGAEFHLGNIERALGNEPQARRHFNECLVLNPGHQKARARLHRPSVFREVAPNLFRRDQSSATPKVLFVLFGALGDVVNGFPVVEALARRFAPAPVVWMTLPRFASLARASAAAWVVEAEPRGTIPWAWVEREGFTHVYYPEGNANSTEFNASGLHMIDFMAGKCEVPLSRRQAILRTAPWAEGEARSFVADHGLRPGRFLAVSHMSITSRPWPHANFEALLRRLDAPVVVFGGLDDPPMPGALSCFGRAFPVVAALIGLAGCFIGPDSGITWLATTTSTPVGVFMDPHRRRLANVGMKAALAGDREWIEEWDISVTPEDVVPFVKNSLERQCSSSRTPHVLSA
jgi:glycosyltransferase involved in cell wall biosynthesis